MTLARVPAESTSSLAVAIHFALPETPRLDLTELHPLLSIVTIAIYAVASEARSWNVTQKFGEAMEDFFADFLDLPCGIPSNRTFNQVFTSLDSWEFRSASTPGCAW